MGNIEKAMGLTKYFVSLPRARVLAGLIIIVSIAFGIMLAYLTEENIFEAELTSFFVLSVPTFLSIIVGKAIMMKVPVRRITAVALIGAVIYAATYLVAVSLPRFGVLVGVEIVFLGSSLVFVLWYLIARIVFVLRWKSLLFAFLQLLLHSFFLISEGLLPFQGSTESVLIKFYFASLVLLGALFLLFWIINAPMKRMFGVASTDAVSMFFGQWFYNANDMETAFRKVGEEAQTYLSVLLFRKKEKETVFVVPYIHFGPFGELGGSNFSHLIAKALENDKKGRDAFVFHGLATHDMNPVSVAELSNITRKCREILGRARARRVKASFASARIGECCAECLRMGNTAFVGLTRAPESCEDFSLGMGIALTAEAEKVVRMAAIVDQHNSEIGRIEYVEPGTSVGFRYMEAVEKACRAEGRWKKLSMGTACCRIESDMVGPAGIKAAVFGTEPKYAIILLDANGITPEFREKIIGEVRRMFAEKGWGRVVPAVYTTDTHKVNTVRGVVNPVREDAKVLEAASKIVEAAYADMGDAEFYGERAVVRLKVFGARQAVEIVSTVNAVVAVARIVAPLIIFGGVITVLWFVSQI